MANFFDQFDAPPLQGGAAPGKGNFFDRFDAPAPVQPARPDPSVKAPPPSGRSSFGGYIDTAVRGAADVLTLGAADEIAAGADALLQPVFGTGAEGGSFGERYGRNLEQQRAVDAEDARDRPITRAVGQVAGGVTGGVGLAKSGLSLGARAAEQAQGLGGLARTAAASAAEGGYLGAAHGFGSGHGGAENRALEAVKGSAIGGVGGLAAPLVVAGVSAVAKPALALLLSRLRPQDYADEAVQTALQRAGMTPEEIADALRLAQEDGQGVFTVADALGPAGQRMLSTTVRNPNEGQQATIEALQARQAGQGRRIVNYLSEGFDAPDTAVARQAALKEARDTAADASYGAAREQAGAVDITGAVSKIDEVLQPGISRLANPQTAIADDTVEGALLRARALLTDGRSNLTDFSAVLRAKQDIDDMIGRATRAGANNQARLLMGVKAELDGALADASAPYAAARDAFRQGSQEIEAVDRGRAAAMRGRPEDTIPAFSAMSDGEQAAFRAGYADPLIGGVQSAAQGVNKVRPLISDATSAEFPAFAAPGKGDQLGQRLAREQRMFETTAEALGNSKTAQRLADDASFQQFDPSVLSALFRGRPVEMILTGMTKVINEAKGMPPGVLKQVAQTLMETRPDAAYALLKRAVDGKASDKASKALVQEILTNLGASAAGRM